MPARAAVGVVEEQADGDCAMFVCCVLLLAGAGGVETAGAG